MRLVKSLVPAVLVAAMATPSLAGGFAPVVVEPVVVIPEPVMAPRSSFGIILPLVLLAGLIGLAVSSGDDDDDDEDDATDTNPA